MINGVNAAAVPTRRILIIPPNIFEAGIDSDNMSSERVECFYTGGGGPPKKNKSESKAWRKVTHVRVSPTVAAIDTGAFSNCRSLREVELCDDGLLRIIEFESFLSCKNLERMKIPSSVEVIGRNAFIHCERLAELELCVGLKQIEQKAFHNCVSLERIVMPSSVKEIGKGAFSDCLKLMNVELWMESTRLRMRLLPVVSLSSLLLYPPVSR